ncbi:MAG: DinB family protein [Candidatus Chryseobacterium colombiense]|nr:DinB family protein [Chryseobacterium sp.]WEK71532.1 MAG: DinB family protein [Chryseobacterium sp.]
MNYHFQAHRQVRKNLLEILQNTSHEDLLLIPDGFNNNIYWNIAHTVATQQLLHYYLSGNPFRIDKYWIETYKKGTLPNFDVQKSEVEDLEFLLTETSKILMKDYDSDFFSDYTPYTTSFGMDLKSIQDAIIFNNMHESLHYGYVMSQKRAILGEKGR